MWYNHDNLNAEDLCAGFPLECYDWTTECQDDLVLGYAAAGLAHPRPNYHRHATDGISHSQVALRARPYEYSRYSRPAHDTVFPSNQSCSPCAESRPTSGLTTGTSDTDVSMSAVPRPATGAGGRPLLQPPTFTPDGAATAPVSHQAQASIPQNPLYPLPQTVSLTQTPGDATLQSGVPSGVSPSYTKSETSEGDRTKPKQKRNKPTLSCEECVERKTKVCTSVFFRRCRCRNPLTVR